MSNKDKIKKEEKVEEKIEKLNNIYSDYSKNLSYLENKQLLVITDLEKKIKDKELKKIRNIDK